MRLHYDTENTPIDRLGVMAQMAEKILLNEDNK